MANFNINVLALPSEPYINDPAIAFFNVFRGTYPSFEDTPEMDMKKMNSEVILRDIIKNNNAIILTSQDVKIGDNTASKAIELATIANVNDLYKVSFIFKESYFESSTGNSVNDPFPNDLLQIGSSFSTLQDLDINLGGSPTNPVEYDISYLNNLYIKNYTDNNFFPGAIKGYIDLFYNFRKSDSAYQTALEEWSILRIQFGFGDNEAQFPNSYNFNQINIITETEFNNELINSGTYPIELYKGTDVNGNLIPIYYYGLNNISDTNAGVEFTSRTHEPGYLPDGTIFTIGLDNGTHQLNKLNPGTSSWNISAILDNSNIVYRKTDMIKYEGPLINGSGNSRWSAWNIIGIINDDDYEPLI